jgi:deoxyadenosine/deoxycytidine kinase
MSSIGPVLVSVEAIIGAGKTTLLEELDARADTLVLREPVDLWEKQRGRDSLLNRYYADQKGNAFMFETYAMMSRVAALRRSLAKVTPEIRAVVVERSWLSSYFCFAANSRDLGHLDDLQASLHEDLFRWGNQTWPQLDGVVFIDLPVSVAQGRVAKRGRTAESSIPSEYQDALDKKHRQWLYGDGSLCFGGPVLTLDGSGDKAHGAVSDMARRVDAFVNQLHAARQQAPADRSPSASGERPAEADVELTPQKQAAEAGVGATVTPIKRVLEPCGEKPAIAETAPGKLMKCEAGA